MGINYQNEDNEVFEEDEQLSDNNNNIEKESELGLNFGIHILSKILYMYLINAPFVIKVILPYVF